MIYFENTKYFQNQNNYTTDLSLFSNPGFYNSPSFDAKTTASIELLAPSFSRTLWR
jgi:hypothetical protein